jgi:hypothetical protein
VGDAFIGGPILSLGEIGSVALQESSANKWNDLAPAAAFGVSFNCTFNGGLHPEPCALNLIE